MAGRQQPPPRARRQNSSLGPGAIQNRITNSLRRRSKTPDYSAVNPFVKYLIFVLNAIFLLVGIALATMGIYILVLKEKKLYMFMDFLLDPACWATLVGLAAALIAFFGCGGALRESIIFLKIYHILLSIFLLLEMIGVIFVFVFYFVDGAFSGIGIYPEDVFKDAVTTYRDDPDNQDLIDNIQELLECCGSSKTETGYKDWEKNPYFNCSVENASPERCSVPFSCCKIQAGENINYRCGVNMLDDTKVSSVTRSATIYTQGCLLGLQNYLTDNIWIVGGVILGVFIPQAFLICIAKALVSQIEEQMSKWNF